MPRRLTDAPDQHLIAPRGLERRRVGAVRRIAVVARIRSSTRWGSVTLEELIDATDEGMYEDKRGKRDAQPVSSF